MRKLCVLLTSIFAGGLTATCLAAGVAECTDRVEEGYSVPGNAVCGDGIVWRNARTGRPVKQGNWISDCFDSLSAGSPYMAGCERPVSRRAEFGYFNCSCRGSYKFPVPPQYTYHWPGMYSQRCMTEYVSPYRFPPLKPYRDQ